MLDTRTRLAFAAVATLVLAATAGTAGAATSAGCVGGAFSALGSSGKTKFDLATAQLPASIFIKGKYVEFEIDTATLGIHNYTMTGATNAMDITGNVRTPIFESKIPDLTGVPLVGNFHLEIKNDNLVAKRGDGLATMKIQAKDCAQGGIFQMEVEREDGKPTLITHKLVTSTQSANLTPFYFDNRNFRAVEGDVLPFGDTTIKVTPRINFANDFSSKFVGRDSAQLAVRRSEPTCTNAIVNRFGVMVPVRHCGAVTRWDVQSGGRLGMVMGEDATEVVPAATDCAADCQAGNQTNGKAVVLGFPFPVPAQDRLQPRLP